MHFISNIRYNPEKQCDDHYYRIKESYRDATGKVKNCIMLNVGFMNPRPCPEDIRDIGKCLSIYMERGRTDLFGNSIQDFNQLVQDKANEYWNMMIEKGTIDRLSEKRNEENKEAKRLVDVNTVKHTDARESGAEWACLQTIRELQIDKFLEQKGWKKNKIDTALSHLITRTIYSSSELKSMRIMNDNSSVCELVTGDLSWRPSFHGVYDVVMDLYRIKDELEDFLCRRTDSMFNLTNRVVLYDLTNFYFESPKLTSKKAKYGRSKEKRTDCKLLVLALCVSSEGFIRYSSILEGNASDPDTLPDMIETIRSRARVPHDNDHKTLVVIDAGIASEDNLKLIKDNGYNYLCVNKKHLTDYVLSDDARTVTVLDSKKQEIQLREVKREENGDYYLEITSPMKELKERSMNRQFKERFENMLMAALNGLSKPRGTKNYEKVVIRIGRAIEKYPSIAKYYEFEYKRSEKKPKNMESFTWTIKQPEQIDKYSGVYFLRTNIHEINERQTWDYYNLIREIECSNRQLKLDLNLRPIYHQSDDRSDAHLFFGMLSYWIVNTIRFKLKQHGIMHYWTELTRILSTQKIITTTGVNALGEIIKFRQSSEPNESVRKIYDALSYKYKPFTKVRICSTQ